MLLSVYLQQRFPKAYGLTRANIAYNERTYNNGVFALCDPVACGRCPNAGGCNHETLIVSSSGPVTVVDFEDFAKQFAGTAAEFVGGCCDYLLYSEDMRQVVFCDLTCSTSDYVNPNTGKYPQGKRAKVFAQLRNSMMKLFEADDLLKLYLLSATCRRLVFGWRDTGAPAADDAEAQMMAFVTTPSSETEQLRSLQYAAGHSFEFVQIKYDTPYGWDVSQ